MGLAKGRGLQSSRIAHWKLDKCDGDLSRVLSCEFPSEEQKMQTSVALTISFSRAELNLIVDIFELYVEYLRGLSGILCILMCIN